MSAEQLTLFPEHAMTPAERRRLLNPKPKTQARGYAAPPGTGPAGETCGSCRYNAVQSGTSGTYHKCRLMEATWTRSAATDIRVRSPACAKWEGKAMDIKA